MGLLANFDAHLVALLIAINSVVISAAILVAIRGYPQDIAHAMLIFSGGKILTAVAFGLIAARGLLPTPLSIILSNIAAVAGFYTNYAAARKLQGKPFGPAFPGAILAVVLAGTVYFTLIAPNLMGVRVVVSAVATVIVATLVLELLVHYRLPGSAHVTTGLVTLAMGAAFLIRLATSLRAFDRPAFADPDGWVEKGFLMSVLLTATMGAVTFVLMCNDAFNSELRRLAVTDPLTGLPNRRRLFERGREEMNRAQRFGRPLAVLLIDCDHFKRINDNWGHGTGDGVLRGIAQALNGSVRNVDMVARLGGEEFAVLLPETPIGIALEIAERLRRTVEAAAFESGGGEPVRMTASIGIAAGSGDLPFEEILDRADAALYEAKEAGRNRVAVASRTLRRLEGVDPV